MKKIIITIVIIFSLVVLLSPAMTLYAQDWTVPTKEDCDALEAAYNAISRALTQAEIDVSPAQQKIWEKEKELEGADNNRSDCEEKLRLCLLGKDREIENLEEKIQELETELAGDMEDVANIQIEYEQVELEIQQWAADHSILGMLGGQGAQIATVGAGSWFLSRLNIASKFLGPIGNIADALGIGLTVSDRLYFEQLVSHADDALERLGEAHGKQRATEEALDSNKASLDKKKAEREDACPDERERLEEAKEQYDKVNGELEELRQQLDELKKKIDELKTKKEEAWDAWWDCMHSMVTYDLTVTASQGGVVVLSSSRGTYQVSAGNTGKGSVSEGAKVNLTALAEGGYVFDTWYGDASGTANTITITMNQDKDIGAIFKPVSGTVEIPEMTGAPAIGPSNVSSGDRITVTVPVTTNTKRVAIRLYNLEGSLSILTYGDLQLGDSIAVIQTPPVRGNIGEQYWLEVYVLAEDLDVFSLYTRNPAKSTSNYTVTYDDGAGNVSESVTNIPIQWLTIVE